MRHVPRAHHRLRARCVCPRRCRWNDREDEDARAPPAEVPGSGGVSRAEHGRTGGNPGASELGKREAAMRSRRDEEVLAVRGGEDRVEALRTRTRWDRE